MPMTPKARVIQFIARMGVRYVERIGTCEQNKQQWEEWQALGAHKAPFMSELGILKDPATVISTVDVHWAHIIHEAGHLLCSEEPLHPKSQEYSWLGWEYALCKQLRIPVSAFIGMQPDYGINWLNRHGQIREEMRDLTPQEIPLFFKERVAVAHALGLILPDGQVTCHPNRKLPPVPSQRLRRAFRSRQPDHDGT